jgi:hypothetical protein
MVGCLSWFGFRIRAGGIPALDATMDRGNRAKAEKQDVTLLRRVICKYHDPPENVARFRDLRDFVTACAGIS